MIQNLRKIKLSLVDKYNDESVIFIDTFSSKLEDEHHFPVIDFSNHAYRLKRDTALELQVIPVKRFCDSFLMFPSPGFPARWLDKKEENEEVWQENLENFITAIYCLTGKKVIAIEGINI